MASHVAPSQTTGEGAVNGDSVFGVNGWVPQTKADRAAVREQLERVLASPVFSRSQRCPSFLSYVVEQALEGQADQLKERNIGVEVFGREPDYDSNSDHVVRSTAGEVRKRLAQYYVDPKHEREIRIEIHPGSYVPELQLPSPSPLSVARIAEFPGEQPIKIAGARYGRRRLQWWLMTAIGLIAMCALLAFGFRTSAEVEPRTALDRFWEPVLASQTPVFLCIGNREWPIPGDQEPPEADPMNANPELTVADVHSIRSQTVHVGDAITMSRMIGLLQSRGSQYRVRTRSATAFSDLRGPSILIGAQNNDWTLRLSRNLRFSFERLDDAVDTSVIRDRENPSNEEWSVAFLVPYLEVTKDYAIVSRVQNAETEQTAVIVAGIGYWGTLAAGEFLTNPAHLKKMEAYAPPGWESMNLQVVLSTDVIGGSSGPPKVLAAHFW